MKKTLFVLLCALAFSACDNKSEDKFDRRILGSWQRQQYEPCEIVGTGWAKMWIDYMLFFAEGDGFKSESYDCNGDIKSGGQSKPGYDVGWWSTYEISSDGNTLTIYVSPDGAQNKDGFTFKYKRIEKIPSSNNN